MLATRFIIALCPATPRYLHADTANQFASEGFYATADKAKARLFDTFDAAMEVAKTIKGWGGAQRVEQVAVEVEDTRQTLATEDDLNEVRDLCTSEWFDACEAAANADWESPRTTVTRAEKWIVKALKDRGLKVSTENRATEDDGTSPSNPLTVYAADHLGNTAQFDFDPMQDGFDITEATCLAEAEPDTATCDGCGKPLSRKAARALRKWGKEKCQRAWHLNRLRGEGLTVCSIETGIPLRSLDSAINAWQEVWEQMFDRDCERAATKAETATCDGCENAFPVDEVEVCGSAEHGPFGFCAACRAKDANASRD